MALSSLDTSAAGAPGFAAAPETLEARLVRMLYHGKDRHELAQLLDQVRLLPDGADKNRLLQSVEMGITIRERFEQHQLRERGLLAVIETAQDLTALTDLDRVLQAIVQRARKLVGCDVGYLSIYDEQRGDFYVRATDGAFSEKFKQVRVGLDVGVCGFVARNRAPYSSSDYEADGRFTHNRLIDSAMVDENIKSILGVPLLAGEHVIGVLFVGERYVRSYVAWEMSMLSTLAAHASVAIGNARLFEQAQQALQQASATNALLSQQTADTRAAAEAHEQLTSLVARGGELPDICHMVAGRLGGHVAVCDGGEREVCQASSAGCEFEHFRQAWPERKHWFEDKIHAALDQSRRLGRSVNAFSMASQVCRVSAVTGGGAGLLGGLIIHTAAPLNDVAVRIFERSSMVTGIVLLLKERRESTALSDIPAVLRRLVLRPQSDPAALARQVQAYGLDLSRPLRMVLVRTGAEKTAYALAQLRSVLQAPAALFDEVGGALVFLVNAASAAGLQDTLLQYFRERRLDFSGVVSEPVAEPSGIPPAFLSAGRCLDFLDALDRRNAIFQERELIMYSSLFGGRGARDIDLFMESALGGLHQGGEPRKAELARTLLAYLDHGYNARAAATALSIHINTFRQRLDVLDALLGPWRDSARALEIHLGLRLWHLRDPAAFSAGISKMSENTP
ncbi:helix-turn-helix domain-containing protein [Pollutimonas bauzanensis]|uniref:GAF domain-containing protein n=1 Tax=Pollutimonas bauzanensis TaxID=658167 RepID=A0A1M5M5Z2_9BURK|nr:GAF domain-containing protein [Pollutimonas bauzanensis]SHG72744.1 GAF domain-containing protein [Pollutimonas bauzanensis]